MSQTAKRAAQDLLADSTPDPVGQFEDALKELESIVQKMERGELKLEDSLKLFERGIALSQQCRKSLDTAELKVRKLLVPVAPADGEA